MPWLLNNLTVFNILLDLFNEKLPDSRSGNSKGDQCEQNSESTQIIVLKSNELKQDLIT